MGEQPAAQSKIFVESMRTDGTIDAEQSFLKRAASRQKLSE